MPRPLMPDAALDPPMTAEEETTYARGMALATAFLVQLQGEDTTTALVALLTTLAQILVTSARAPDATCLRVINDQLASCVAHVRARQAPPAGRPS